MEETDVLRAYYSSKESVGAEIINLKAILALPKGTEHFLSDLHGENETFEHLLRNASGVIRQKINETFGDKLSDEEKKELAALIYYPSERIAIVRSRTPDMALWYRETLGKLTEMTRVTASKYTRSKVRKALPPTYAYILDEMIHIPTHMQDKEAYYSDIISGIISLGEADGVIREICHLIQRLAIDKLHIVGDIFDRGGGADSILDRLEQYHDVDIQWGNHDILWMGAHFGNLACICNVIRINTKYNNLHILENGYGINLRKLYSYSAARFSDDECREYEIKELSEFENPAALAKMHKAITLLQFKAEHAVMRAHPEYEMQNRLFIPQRLAIGEEFTAEEETILKELRASFTGSKRLKEHVRFLLRKGAMYTRCNGNLLMHGCVPTDENGEFTSVNVLGRRYSGKALYDALNDVVRRAATDAACNDYMWYLWCGKNSPVYGRNVMATYEEYYDKEHFSEIKNDYYRYIREQSFCEKILAEFGLDPATGHIINGHMPVRVKNGENPVSGGGKHITIDGGMNKAYRRTTGIAGYTLISNSHGLILVSHAPFASKAEAVANLKDLESVSEMIERYPHRVFVRETDTGKLIQKQVEALEALYRSY